MLRRIGIFSGWTLLVALLVIAVRVTFPGPSHLQATANTLDQQQTLSSSTPTRVPTQDPACRDLDTSTAEHAEIQRCTQLLRAREAEMGRMEQEGLLDRPTQTGPTQTASTQTASIQLTQPEEVPMSLANENRIFEVDPSQYSDDIYLRGSTSVWNLAAFESEEFYLFTRLYLVARPSTDTNPPSLRLQLSGEPFGLAEPEKYQGEWPAPEEIGWIKITDVTGSIMTSNGPAGLVKFKTSTGRTGEFNLGTHQWTLHAIVPTPTPLLGLLEAQPETLEGMDEYIVQNEWRGYIGDQLVHVIAVDVPQGFPGHGSVMVGVDKDGTIQSGHFYTLHPSGPIRIVSVDGITVHLVPVNGGETFIFDLLSSRFLTNAGAPYPTMTPVIP
jgi:hypothetical protein